MSDDVARKLVEARSSLDVKVQDAIRAKNRIITAAGEVRSAETLRDADLDHLVEDVTTLCQLKIEVTALLRMISELARG